MRRSREQRPGASAHESRGLHAEAGSTVLWACGIGDQSKDGRIHIRELLAVGKDQARATYRALLAAKALGHQPDETK